MHRLHVVPIVVVYLNNICDSRCVTCSIWKNNETLRQSSDRQMTGAMLHELYERLGQWHPRQVLLSGGEPLLHPRFGEAAAKFAAIVPKVCLITNGLLLSSFDSSQLKHLAEFYISFDAPDREGYLKIRGVDGFDRLANGIQVLRRLSHRPTVVARCTLQRNNVERLPELIARARQLGFHRISFLGVDVSTQAFSRDVHGPAAAANMQPTSGDLTIMSAAIKSLENADDGFIEGGTGKLDRILQYFRALNGDIDFPAMRCNAPWVSVVIETTGQIRGCFFQPVIGDFRDLNGEKAVAFRRTLNVSTDQICRRCVCSKFLSAPDFLRI
jgi:MoaA/NifB/PqqE/SkfB family radical SAM enzyme